MLSKGQRWEMICVGSLYLYSFFSSTWCDTPYIRLIVISLWQISLKEVVIAAFVAITKSLCRFYWLWNGELKSYKYCKITFTLKDYRHYPFRSNDGENFGFYDGIKIMSFICATINCSIGHLIYYIPETN